MVQFIVALFGGASLGATFALISLGMVLAFRATHTFNFAQGEFMVIPALVLGDAQLNNGASTPVAIIEGLVVVGAIGAVFYILVLQRTSGFLTTVATLGLAAALDGAINMRWGGQALPVNLSVLPTGTITIAGARISTASITWIVFTLILVVGTACALQFTHLGRKVRVAGQNDVLASQSGVNVRAIHIGSWAATAVLAGVAGIAFASTSLASITMVQLPLVAAPAMVLGGLDSIWGAIVGGVIIGMFQSFVASYASAGLQDLATYILLLVIILVLPDGIFGTREVRRV